MIVAVDTEGSGLHPDDGARVSIVSWAWRGKDGKIQTRAIPFDQGVQAEPAEGLHMPSGDKLLPATHARRVAKWDPQDRQAAPNKSPQDWLELMAWLRRHQLVMHNMPYDCLMIRAGLRAVEGGTGGTDLEPHVIWDTKPAQDILDPAESSSLKPTSMRLHLGEELGLQDGEEGSDQAALQPWLGPKTDPRYDLVPWRVIGPYAGMDAALTLLLAEFQWSRLDEDEAGHAALIAAQLQQARTLHHMHVLGVKLDAEGMRKEAAKLQAMIDQAAALVPFRGKTKGAGPTYPAAQKYFFGPESEGGLGLLPYSDKMTAGGNPQVDEEVVERLVKLGARGAAEFQTWAELRSAMDKWYGAWPAFVGPDGRIRTVYRQGKVVSGRLSVERWQSQAIPHDYQIPEGLVPVRYFLDEDEDWVNVEIDASQCEIRVATYVARCGPMLRLLKAGIDSHDAACLLMFYPGMTLEQAKADPGWERLRQVAKRCNLGILYGIGAGGLKTQILKFTGMVVSVSQCREWIQDYRHAMPAFGRALDDSADMAARTGMVRMPSGRLRIFSHWEPHHKAFNQIVQGSVADAMVEIMNKADQRFPGSLMLQIHDSLVMRLRRETWQRDAAWVARLMVSVFERRYKPVPFKADVKLWGRSYYRDREERQALEQAESEMAAA